MNNIQTPTTVSVAKTTLTALLTTSLLMACTQSQQDKEHVNAQPTTLGTIAAIEQESEMLELAGKSLKPSSQQLLMAEEKLNKHKAAKAQPSSQRNRMMYADQISGLANYSAMPLHSIRQAREELDRENYQHFETSQIKLVGEDPVSTFSIDVDTGSYSNIRRMINAGNLPREDAVRIEELINYFSYNYPDSDNKDVPFSVTTEIATTPWNANTRLMHIGIKGYDIAEKDLPPSNLVFLVDVSGSMNSPDKLGLLKSALKLLSKQMRDEDRISIVVYAGASGIVLEPVAGNQSAKIANALDALSAGGSTNGAAGIRSAYQLAEQEFIEDGINRVILATDGDFNVGTVNFEALKDLVEEKRKTGISLTTLGFGRGNYNDHLMEQLADAGNGNYAYIDTLNEAQKVLVDEMSSTLNTIAKDVKIQIEFNPAIVAEYRLIGYENRALNREDFNNDKVDAGEIGAGHTVTALYELTLTNSKHRSIDVLRYSAQTRNKEDYQDELATLRIRYKEPEENKSKLIEQFIKTSDIEKQLANTSDRYRFSASVAGFGQLLRGGKYTENFSYENILDLARKSRGKDNFGYRGEFISLVNLTKSLSSKSLHSTSLSSSTISPATENDLQATR